MFKSHFAIINQEIIAYVEFLDMDIIEHTLEVEMEARNV
jgi:hypothetical protein